MLEIEYGYQSYANTINNKELYYYSLYNALIVMIINWDYIHKRSNKFYLYNINSILKTQNQKLE